MCRRPGSGQEFVTIIERLAVVHVKNNTFPAEELPGLAADAMEESPATRSHPIDYERIRENYLPERVFRGKVEHHRSNYALRAAAHEHYRCVDRQCDLRTRGRLLPMPVVWVTPFGTSELYRSGFGAAAHHL